MSKILVITGDLATGKSTFANIISKKFKVLLLTKDRVKEILGDNIGFNNREENLKLSNATMALLFYVLEQSVKVNECLILEANFKENDFKRLAEIVSYDQILVLNLTADYDILYERFMKRINNENRHIVHQSAGLTNKNKFIDYLAKGRSIDLAKYRVINISANDFSYQNDENIYKTIKEFFYE